MKKTTILSMIAMILAAVTLAGCKTVRGVGQDVQSGGRAIERAANK